MTPKKVEKPQDENESRVQYWNECISPRLEVMRSWFLSEAWKKGLHPYMNLMLGQRRDHLERQANDTASDQFIKGQIAMLKQIMGIPDVINNQIEQIKANQEKGPSGDAGY